MRWLCLLLLVFAPVGAAQAQLKIFADEQARQASQRNAEKLENLTALIRDLSEQNRQLRKQLTSMSQQHQEVRQELRELSGEAEELRRAVGQQGEEMRRALESPQILNKIAELGERLTELAGEVAHMGQFITLPPEQELYDAAYGNLQQQQHRTAIDEFNRMLKLYPQGRFAANARYWISKAHLALQEYDAAKAAAEALMAEYPNNDRRAETILILAEAMRGLGMNAEARERLLLLLDEFPTSLAADEARRLLAQ